LGYLALSYLLLVTAIGLLVIDLFLPSAGLLLALSIIAAIAADLFAFRASFQAGLLILAIELALVPVAAWLFVVVWPRTPLGKRMIIPQPKAEPFRWEQETLVGKVGVALDDFLPTGRVDIEGSKHDAICEVGTLTKGDPVIVLREELGTLVVTLQRAEGYEKTHSPNASQANQKASKQNVDSALDHPASELGLDSIESNRDDR
jgi:membrane-bound ClpP family serine protease